MASLHDVSHERFLDILHKVYGLIETGPDVNVVDKVSYHQAPNYNN